MLTESGVVRQDIRSSIGGASGVAEGVDLTIRLRVVDAGNDCAPLAGAAVYLWHCDREGRYSMYSEGAEDENYLRGVQAAGSDGLVSFTSIFPACYPGRWPHIHFEVYPSVEAATDAGNIIATPQMPCPGRPATRSTRLPATSPASRRSAASRSTATTSSARTPGPSSSGR